MTCCKENRRFSAAFLDLKTGHILTPKFYARHDNLDDNIEIVNKAKIFQQEMMNQLQFDRRKLLPAPVTTNQEYGWLEAAASRYKLNEFQFRKPADDKDFHEYMNIITRARAGVKLR